MPHELNLPPVEQDGLNLPGSVPSGPAPPIPERPRDNALTKFGLVLSNIAAGARGQPLPSVERGKLRAQQEAEGRRAERDAGRFALQVNARLKADIDGLNDEQAAPIIAQYTKNFGQAAGGIDFAELVPQLRALTIDPKVLTTLVGDPDIADAILAITNGDREEVLNLASNEGFVKQALASIDARNGPGFLAKLDEVLGIIHDPSQQTQGLEQFVSGLPRDDAGKLIITEANIGQLNEFLPEPITPAEFSFFERNPEELAQREIVLGTTTAKRQEDKPLEQIAAESAARERGTQAERPDEPRLGSPEGKLIADIEIAKGMFGKDSEQVTALQDALKGEQAGDPPSFSDISGMRKEFTKGSGLFITIRDAFAKVTSAAADPSAAGDIGIIFNFMKILDPQSVVREGEFATAANAGSVGQRIIARYNSIVSGERLSDDQRADFISQAQGLFNTQLSSQLRLEQEFKRLANATGVDSGKVIIDFVGPFRPGEAGKVTAGDIGDMSAADLFSIVGDPNLTDEQVAAIDAALKAKGF